MALLGGCQFPIKTHHLGSTHREGSGLGGGVLVALDRGVEEWLGRRVLEKLVGSLIEPPHHRIEVGGAPAGAEQCSTNFAVAVEEGFAAGDDLLVADGEQAGEDFFRHIVEQLCQLGLLDRCAIKVLERVCLLLDPDDFEGFTPVICQQRTEA